MAKTVPTFISLTLIFIDEKKELRIITHGEFFGNIIDRRLIIS